MLRRKIIFLAVSVFLMLALLLPLMVSAEGSSDVIYAENLDEFIQISHEMKNRCSVMTAQSNDANGSSGGTARILLRTDGTVLDLSTYPTVMAVRDSANWYILQFASQEDADEALESLSGQSGVLWAEMDQYVSFLQGDNIDNQEQSVIESSPIKGTEKVSGSNEGDSDSDGKLYSTATFKSWGATNIGADTLSAYLSENGYTDSIVVAVVDSGADTDHAFLKNRLVSGYNFVDMNSKPEDDNGHGSHVSGTIVDCTPGLNVKIMPLKALNEDGEGYTSDVVSGVRWAVKKGAKVINMSLGGSHSSALDSAVNDACSAGVVCVVSSGNEGKNASTSCPAHITAAITVGAVQSDETRAYFSNYGSVLDVVAPGVSIKSSVPGGDYASYSGTSMAAPHVSALCAMLRLLYPGDTPAQIQSLLKDSCRDLGTSGFDNYYGYGIPDMNNVVSNVTVEADPASLVMKPGDTQTVHISCSGTIPSGAKLQATVSAKAVAGAEWLSQSFTEGSTLQIKGLASGEANATVSLLSAKETVLSQTTITVSVKDYSLTVSPASISMNVGESVTLSVTPKDSLPSGARYRCSFSGNAFSGSWNGSELTLKALKSAKGEILIEAVSAEEEVLSSVKVPYTLVYNLHMSASPESLWLQFDETLTLDISFDELSSDWTAQAVGNDEIAELAAESIDLSAGRIRYTLKGLSAGSFDLIVSLKNEVDQGSNSITVPVTVVAPIELSTEPAQFDAHVGCVSTVTITASEALPEGAHYTVSNKDEAIGLSLKGNILSLSGLEEGSGSFPVCAYTADGRKIAELELGYTVSLVTLDLVASPDSIALETKESQSVKLSTSETLAKGSYYGCDTESEFVSISISEDVLNVTGLEEGSGSLDVKLYAENGSLLGSLVLPYTVSKKDYQLKVTPESIEMEVGESIMLYSKFLKLEEGMLELSVDSDALDFEEISGSVDKGWVKDKLTALKKGSCTLHVRLLDLEGNELASKEIPVKITKNTKKIEKIKLNKSSFTLKIYGKVKPMALLTATITPTTALNQTLKWKSSNSKVAKVNQDGIVSAAGEGTATITAYAQDGSGVKAACTVTVKKLSNSGKLITGYKLKKTISTLALGESYTLELNYSPSNASWQKSLFFSSKPNVASIDQNGTIQALKAGKTKITCMAADGSGKKLEFILKVIQLAEELSLDTSSATLKRGKTLQLSATILPKNVSITTLKWASSNTKVATVDENGLVKAVGKGECKIVCTTTDGSGLKVKCKITVK